jgi:hypothetical protein
MNKGKVRDNEQLKYKLQLVAKIIFLTGHRKGSDYERTLLSKGSKALNRMLENLGGR